MRFPHWLALATFLAAGILLWNLREVIIQIFAAIVLAVAICTLVDKIRAIKTMPRSFALLICISSIFTLLTLVFVLVLPPFTKEFQELITQLPKAASTLMEMAIKTVDNIYELIYGRNQERS